MNMIRKGEEAGSKGRCQLNAVCSEAVRYYLDFPYSSIPSIPSFSSSLKLRNGNIQDVEDREKTRCDPEHRDIEVVILIQIWFIWRPLSDVGKPQKPISEPNNGRQIALMVLASAGRRTRRPIRETEVCGKESLNMPENST